MSHDVLLVEIEFNSKNWYLSEEGHFSDNYYAPYLAESPSLEIGQIKGGYIGVRIGDISIANRPNDRFSPFSIYGGGYNVLLKNPTQKIPVKIFWQQNKDSLSLFDGKMYLKSFDTDKFDFLLEEKFDDIDLLTSSPDITSEFEEIVTVSIRGQGLTALVTSPEHELETGDKISVIGANNTEFNTPFQGSIPTKVEITKVDDNFFTYPITVSSTAFELAGDYKLRTLIRKPNPFSFGRVIREKGIIQIDDGTGTYSGYAYSNPQLDPTTPTDSTNALYLYDDGVLHGTTYNPTGNPTEFRVLDISSVSSDIDIATITTVQNHNLVAGDVVSVFGLLPEYVNSTSVVSDISDTNPKVFYYYIGNMDDAPSISAGGGYVHAFGEYFGDARYPTDDVIFSRAARNDLGFDGNGNLETGPYPTSSSSPTTVSSKDGTVLIGTPLVSGVSKNGKTVADFFAYLATKLGISSVNFENAPNASSVNLDLWRTTQAKLVEFAGEVALGANYLFEIKNNQIRVIDRGYVSDNFITIPSYEIIDADYVMPNPIKAIYAKWKTSLVNAVTIPAQLDERDESIMITNSASGEIREVVNVNKSYKEQREILFSIKDILNKCVISLNVGSIRGDINIGTRIKANRIEDGVSIDMTVRTINYDFANLSTKIVGDGNLIVLEQDQVY